jgi:hypothetical protein
LLNQGKLPGRLQTVVRARPRTALAAGAAIMIALFAVTNFALHPETEAAIAVVGGEAAGPVVAAPADTAAAGGEQGTVAPPSAAGVAQPVTAPLPRLIPVPAGERVPKPAEVRGLYLNAWAAGSPRKLARLIDTANRTEINTFVIDVKEGGEVSYRSSVPLVAAIGSDRAHIRDIRGVLAKLRENGIYPIARIVVFRDRVAADARPEWAVVKADGSLWHDHHGDAWVDSYNREVWDYNIAIAREAIELGFSEVQWDYVRFPDVPRSYMRTAVWPAAAGRAKADAIAEFLRYSREQLTDLGVPVTADVFGLTVSARDDMGIGQLWEKMVDATDVLLPMVYPSHFARGSYGIADPNSAPYEIIKTAMGHALRRTNGVANAATIRPWLQDFTLGLPRYGPYYVRAQMDAVYDAGLTEWVLWNPGSNYTVEALTGEDGIAPTFARPAPPDPPRTDTASTGERRPRLQPDGIEPRDSTRVRGRRSGG